MEAKEMLELISKQYATSEDIKKLAGCGINEARRINNEIKEKLKDYYLPSYKVPMEEVVKYLNININYLKKVERS